MLIGLLGTPSPLTYWTLHAVRAAVQVLHSEYSMIHAFRAEDVRSSAPDGGGPSPKAVIVFSDLADSALCELLLSVDCPLACIADEPDDLVSFLVASRAMKAEHALRAMSQSISSLEALAGHKRVWNIRHEQYSDSIEDFVRAIVDWCGFAAQEAEIQQIAAQLATGHRPLVGDGIVQVFPDARWPGTYAVLEEAAQSLTQRVAGQYGALLRDEPFDRALWPREIFCAWSQPESFLTGPQAMAGRARFLTCGPYLHLPRGEWNARVEIEVDNNLSGNAIRSDVVCGDKVVAEISAELPARGVFCFEMPFAVREPFLPLQLRIEMLQGAIEGDFLLRLAELTRLDGARTAGREGADRATLNAKTLRHLQDARTAGANPMAAQRDE